MSEERERRLRQKAAEHGTTLEEARGSTTYRVGFWGPIVLFIVLFAYGCFSLIR